MTSFWEILKSSKNLKASDAFAELWGKSIADSWDIITITGTLPLMFEAKGEALTNYRLYGTSEGAGVQTENLFDKDAKNTDNGYVANYYLAANDSVIESTGYGISEYMLVSPNTEYTISVGARYNNPSVCIYDETKTYIEGFAYGRNNPKTITTGATAKYIRISFFSPSASITAVMKSSDMSDPYIYIPYGYQIPLTNTSGVTENLFDKDEYLNAYKPNVILNEYGSEISSTVNGYSTYKINVIPEQTYTLKGQTSAAYTYVSRIYWLGSNDEFLGRSDSFENVSSNSILTFTTPQNCYKIEMQFSVGLDFSDVILVKGSTAPDHYIPHRYTADYNLYIGSTKLGAEEYVDYGEQKVWKMVDGTLTPTDPPVPFPAISTYQGENTLSSTETVGEVSVTGKIKEI